MMRGNSVIYDMGIKITENTSGTSSETMPISISRFIIFSKSSNIAGYKAFKSAPLESPFSNLIAETFPSIPIVTEIRTSISGVFG